MTHSHSIDTMNAKTRKAVNGSIKKWEGIRDGKVKDNGMSDCALCQLFFVMRKPNGQRCDGCPVKIFTGEDNCVASPYSHWALAGGRYHTADTPKLKRLATAELNFLKSLLPKKGKK